MTSLVSSIMGNYDKPKPLPEGHGFDRAVLVTDVPTWVDGWQVVVVPSDEHPRLAAKVAKMLPWLWVDDDRSLWLDGSFEVLPGLRDVVDEHLTDADVVAWRHPSGRLDAYEEAEFSAGYSKYLPVRDAMAAQVADYRRAGLPPASGLWECGMLARRHTEEVRRHGQAWLQQVRRYTIQDQVSFPFVNWARGVEVAPWRADSHWSCGWVRWHAHRDES